MHCADPVVTKESWQVTVIYDNFDGQSNKVTYKLSAWRKQLQFWINPQTNI